MENSHSSQYRQLVEQDLTQKDSNELFIDPSMEQRLFEVSSQVAALIGQVPTFMKVECNGRADADLQSWLKRKERTNTDNFFARVPSLDLNSKYFEHYFGPEVMKQIEDAVLTTGGVFALPEGLTHDASYGALIFAISRLQQKSPVRLVVSSDAAPRLSILSNEYSQGIHVTDVRKPWNFDFQKLSHERSGIIKCKENQMGTDKVKAEILDCNGRDQKVCIIVTEDEARALCADRGVFSKLARVVQPNVIPVQRVTPIEFPEYVANGLDVDHRDILLGARTDEVPEKVGSWGQLGQEKVIEQLVRTGLVSSFLQPRHLLVRGDYGVGKSVAMNRARLIALRAGAACLAADETLPRWDKNSHYEMIAAGNPSLTTLAQSQSWNGVFLLDKEKSLGKTVWVDDSIAMGEVNPVSRAALMTEQVALVGLSNASEKTLLRFCGDLEFLDGSVDIIDCPGSDWNAALLNSADAGESVSAPVSETIPSAPSAEIVDTDSQQNNATKLREVVKALGLEDKNFDADSREFQLSLGRLQGRVLVQRAANGDVSLSFIADNHREEIVFGLMAPEFTESGRQKKENFVLRKNTLREGDWLQIFNDLLSKIKSAPAIEVVPHPKLRNTPKLEKRTSSNAFTAHCAHILYRLFDLHPFPREIDQERRNKGSYANRIRFTVSREGVAQEVELIYRLGCTAHSSRHDTADVSVAINGAVINFGFSPENLFGDRLHYPYPQAVENPSRLHPRQYAAESYNSPKYTRRVGSFIVNERPSIDMKFTRDYDIGKWVNVEGTAMLSYCCVDGHNIESEECSKNVEKQGMEAIEAFDLLLWNLQQE